ncbi:MAG: DUF3343 domain-containing protein, partial [Romboutsia sp.]
AMEKACKSAQVPGRLIPVPRQISAGCGLSWLCNVEDKFNVENLLKDNNLEFENIHDIIM